MTIPAAQNSLFLSSVSLALRLHWLAMVSVAPMPMMPASPFPPEQQLARGEEDEATDLFRDDPVFAQFAATSSESEVAYTWKVRVTVNGRGSCGQRIVWAEDRMGIGQWPSSCLTAFQLFSCKLCLLSQMLSCIAGYTLHCMILLSLVCYAVYHACMVHVTMHALYYL